VSYEGWGNYETWLVNSWLGSEPEERNYWYNAAKTAIAIYNKEAAIAKMTVRMKQFYREEMPRVPEVSGLYLYLLDAVLDMVNWREISENFVEIALADEEG